MPTENSFDSGYDSPASDAASGIKENSNVESSSMLTSFASTSTPADSKGPPPSEENITVARLVQGVEDFEKIVFLEEAKQLIVKGLRSIINDLKQAGLRENDQIPPHIVDALKKLNLLFSFQSELKPKSKLEAAYGPQMACLAAAWTPQPQPASELSPPSVLESVGSSSKQEENTQEVNSGAQINNICNRIVKLNPEQHAELKSIFDNKRNISLWTALMDYEKYKSFSTPDAFLENVSVGKLNDISFVVREELRKQEENLRNLPRIKEDVINTYDETSRALRKQCAVEEPAIGVGCRAKQATHHAVKSWWEARGHEALR